jgi:hypothetical protein
MKFPAQHRTASASSAYEASAGLAGACAGVVAREEW